ncbi:MAG TPA: ADP-ribosylglycohydrolase family protein [Chloroflexota bacterium]|nr:ADP-ribosylglycohydrolase family protein [Chloroflexota bacterium]
MIPSDIVLRDRFRGSLLWGAVGDALGCRVEGWAPGRIRERFGEEGLRHYIPWHGWREGPIGTITDDTQLTIEVARSLLATNGRFRPHDFVTRLIAWLPIGRGKGRATTEAVEALGRGVPWWRISQIVDSAGNGAAMRAAPIGLLHAADASPADLVHEAILSALPTHTHPVGVAGAVAIAAGVAWSVQNAGAQEEPCDVRGCVGFISACLDGLEPEPTPERKPGGKTVRLSERIRELPDFLDTPDPREVFAYIFNGAFALESVPAALYCFLRSPDDPRQVILTAVNAGRDADSVASMAGNLVGAWCGAECLARDEPEWWEQLEYRDTLVSLADGLADSAPRE